MLYKRGLFHLGMTQFGNNGQLDNDNDASMDFVMDMSNCLDFKTVLEELITNSGQL